MSRYTGPKFKLSRRLGISLSGSGKELSKRAYPPGQHGPGRPRKISDYGLQLREKQRLRHRYGVSETQFRNLFDQASRMPGITGENLMVLLESRLDNLVYRLSMATTCAAARQLVAHGHVTVNGKRVNIASHVCRPGDVIGLRPGSRDLAVIGEAMAHRRLIPGYLQLDDRALRGTYVRHPERGELPQEVDVQQVVEFYSR